LNGEYIDDPENEPNRFQILQQNDFVIFDFIGDLEPIVVRAVFIAKASTLDSNLHAVLHTFIGNKSMVELTTKDLEQLISKTSLPEQHPANLLILESNLEDAAYNGITGVRALRSGPYQGKVSRQNLEQARKNAERTGRAGEELIAAYLQQKKEQGTILGVQWVADENAISPYDFSVEEIGRSITHIDVKSTVGGFNSRIHISYNELLQMQVSDRYDLYRVYEMNITSAKLRIAHNLKEFAESIINVFRQLPSGIQPDSISVYPSDLTFGEEIIVDIPENIE
jgi:hypothetical protein